MPQQTKSNWNRFGGGKQAIERALSLCNSDFCRFLNKFRTHARDGHLTARCIKTKSKVAASHGIFLVAFSVSPGWPWSVLRKRFEGDDVRIVNHKFRMWRAHRTYDWKIWDLCFWRIAYLPRRRNAHIKYIWNAKNGITMRIIHIFRFIKSIFISCAHFSPISLSGSRRKTCHFASFYDMFFFAHDFIADRRLSIRITITNTWLKTV